MTVGELYAELENRVPRALSCDWDNDGLMCCPDADAPVRRVLVVLDITAAMVEKAIAEGYDLIVSHHPLIFSPLRAMDPGDPVAKKVIRLLRAGVSAMRFHTRLDAVEGGVNDVLAEALGLLDVEAFGPENERIGRIGTLPETFHAGSHQTRRSRASQTPRTAGDVREYSPSRPSTRARCRGWGYRSSERQRSDSIFPRRRASRPRWQSPSRTDNGAEPTHATSAAGPTRSKGL